MSAKRSKWDGAGVVFVIGIFLFSQLLIFIQESKLKSCSVISKGYIYKRIHRIKRMPKIFYRYSVNGIQYSNSESIFGRDDVYLAGDSIPIRYYCDDPSVCTYIRRKSDDGLEINYYQNGDTLRSFRSDDILPPKGPIPDLLFKPVKIEITIEKETMVYFPVEYNDDKFILTD